MSARKWPTALPLVDKLRSCMLQSVPHNQTSGACSSLPYEAAELIHDLHDALAGLLAVPKIAGCRPCGGTDLSYGPLENVFATADAALAKARGEQ